MSHKIFKYPLEVTDRQNVNMPVGAEILCVQVQRNIPTLWALVNPEAPPERRVIDTYGTGHPVADVPGKYIGTYQIEDGHLVFHVFEKI